MSDYRLLEYLTGAGRLQILEELVSYPTKRFTIASLARAGGAPLTSTWRAIQDLQHLGLVLVERIGPIAAVQAGIRSPLWKQVEGLVRADWSMPHERAFRFFEERTRKALPGVGVHLFGSVLRGTHEPGSDVDVEVVYGESRFGRRRVEKAVDELAMAASDRFGVPVTAIVAKDRNVSK